jgi:starch synthase (maltosyl-transferring)
VRIQADLFVDGHDAISAVLKHRQASQAQWSEVAMELVVNDRWQASFTVEALGDYFYTVEAWVNHFQSWRRDLEKKVKAGQDIKVELQAGIILVKRAWCRAKPVNADDGQALRSVLEILSSGPEITDLAKTTVAISPRLGELMGRYGEREHVVRSPVLRVMVDPVLASSGAWYELFPRSTSSDPTRPGTLKDCELWLSRISKMGFDVLYLTPIHPIGETHRKGKNNNLACLPGDPGSPWAIGSRRGGHKSIDPALGTLEDFRRLVRRARELKIEVALDMAFQCSPDHPWVQEHPQWFHKRPDGSIQYAENPPKKYQDIYPLNFETEDWQALWCELKSVFEFWIEQGISVFRVDNPHTKPFRFWEWCLGELKAARPDLIFLCEAFTRPKVMFYLAKIGFSQSYNYFPWRNTKYELTEYLSELAQTEVIEFFRPNLWPNTPDILTEYLRYGGRAAFMTRLILASTLGPSYGIYGPAFEVCENQPREPNSEEYLNSEKYEVRHWNLEAPGNLTNLITRLNQIRQEHAAFQSNRGLSFLTIDNEQLMAYTKTSTAPEERVIVVVNLDPHHVQRGWLSLPLEQWGLRPRDNYQLEDLLTGAHYLWNGPRNFVELDPQFLPAHVLWLRRYVRTEQDFDYFM